MAWLNDGELSLERCRAPVEKRATNNYALLLDVSLRCWCWKYDGGSGSSLRDVTVTAAGRSVGRYPVSSRGLRLRWREQRLDRGNCDNFETVDPDNSD